MTIEHLGSIGSFIGGIGVVITLVYLATQIRQNTRSLRLTSIQQIMGTSASLNEMASNGPIPPILAKLEMGQRLDEKEFAQYLMYLFGMLTHHWQVFYQFRNGMIDAAVFDAYIMRLRVILSTSLSQALWRSRIKHSFTTEYQAFVDSCIEADRE